MSEMPLLATEDQIRALFGVTDRTVRNWKRNGMESVGSYCPPGVKPEPLYSITDVHRYRARVAA